jgi:hypothetical protein
MIVLKPVPVTRPSYRGQCCSSLFLGKYFGNHEIGVTKTTVDIIKICDTYNYTGL